MKKNMLRYVVLAALVVTALSVNAAQWDGDDGEGRLTWWNNYYGNNPGSWNSTTDLEFNYNNSGHTTLTHDWGSWLDVRSIIYNETFTQNTTLGSSGNGFNLYFKVENLDTGSHTINAPISVKGIAFEINPISGNLTIGGTIYNDDNRTLQVYGNNGNTLTLNSALGGSGGLTVEQNSTVVIGTAQTYTGDTTIKAGSVQLGGANRISDSSAIVISGGTFNMANNNETVRNISSSGGTVAIGTGQLIVNEAAGTWSGSLSASSSGSLVKKGSGTVSLTGANTGLASGSALYLVGGTTGLNNNNAAGSATIYLGETGGSDTAKIDISAADTTIANAITVRSGSAGAKTIDNASGGAITFSGAITLDANVDISASSGETINFNGTISGSGHMVKKDAGLLVLSAANANSSAIYVDQGTVRLNNNSAAGTGTIYLGAEFGGGNLTLDSTLANVSIGNAINVRSSGDGTKTIDNATGGTMTLGGAITLAGGATFTAGSGETTVIGGGLSGAGSLLKQGAGNLQISSTATLGNTLYFDEGKLVVASGGSIAGAGKTVDLGSAAYNPGGGAGAANATLELQSGNSGISANIAVKAGSGTRAITSAGGTISGAIALENNLDITSSSGTLTLSGAVNLSNSGNNDLRVGGAGNTTIQGAISAAEGSSSIDKSGSGTLTLSGNNSGSLFMLNVAQGTVALNDANALGNGYGDKVNFTGSGTLDVNANIGPSSLGLRVENGQTATLDVNNGNTFTVATLANISGSGTFDKTGAGTLALTGNSGSFNGLTLSAGTLSVGSSASIGTITQSGGTISVASGGSVGATTANSGSLTVSGTAGNLTVGGASVTVSGTAGTINLSSGTVVVDGSSGAVTLSGGTLEGSGTISGLTQTGGVLSPGNSPETLTISGSATWTSGTYLWEINRLAADGGTQGNDPGWDFVDISGSLTIGAGYVFAIDDIAALTSWNSSDSYSWRVVSVRDGLTQQSVDNLVLNTTAWNTPFTGTFDLRFVALGGGAGEIWLDYAGNSEPPPEPGSAVPEPTTISFALLSGMALYSMRRYVRREMRAAQAA